MKQKLKESYDFIKEKAKQERENNALHFGINYDTLKEKEEGELKRVESKKDLINLNISGFAVIVFWFFVIFGVLHIF